jgi:hypothetical protein
MEEFNLNEPKKKSFKDKIIEFNNKHGEKGNDTKRITNNTLLYVTLGVLGVCGVEGKALTIPSVGKQTGYIFIICFLLFILFDIIKFIKWIIKKGKEKSTIVSNSEKEINNRGGN